MTRDSQLTTMRRRVAAKVSRMTLAECQDWWDRWVAASAGGSAAGNLHTLGEMTSALTGASEPSASQAIKGYVRRKVFDQMKKLSRNQSGGEYRRTVANLVQYLKIVVDIT